MNTSTRETLFRMFVMPHIIKLDMRKTTLTFHNVTAIGSEYCAKCYIVPSEGMLHVGFEDKECANGFGRAVKRK